MMTPLQRIEYLAALARLKTIVAGGPHPLDGVDTESLAGVILGAVITHQPPSQIAFVLDQMAPNLRATIARIASSGRDFETAFRGVAEEYMDKAVPYILNLATVEAQMPPALLASEFHSQCARCLYTAPLPGFVGACPGCGQLPPTREELTRSRRTHTRRKREAAN